MTLFHSFIDEKTSLMLANNLRLFYGERRPAKRLQRFNGPNINRQLGVSIMPLIPNTALIIFLQGGAL